MEFSGCSGRKGLTILHSMKYPCVLGSLHLHCGDASCPNLSWYSTKGPWPVRSEISLYKAVLGSCSSGGLATTSRPPPSVGLGVGVPPTFEYQFFP
jgi:hypothetical protein